MSNEKLPSRKVLFAKIIGGLIALISAIFGVGPSVVSKFHSTPSSISAEGGSTTNTGKMNTDNTTTVNTTTTNNYLPGGGGGVLAENEDKILLSSVNKGSPAISSSVNDAPEVDALGILVMNASLLNNATWEPEISRITRSVNFRFYVEAVTDSEKYGYVNVTLTRDGKDICTISLNSKMSDSGKGVRRDEASCKDTLQSKSAVVYRAKVVASEMIPIVVKLIRVDAVKK